jgi:hypothetical protein
VTTLITHIFNEEFLLPFWINHHKGKFDNVIVIDYNSTDASLEIIREMAPEWQVITSPTHFFDAQLLDEFITTLESKIKGNKLVLTITEFLIGDPRSVKQEKLVIPSTELICLPGEVEFDSSRPFHDQIRIGIPYLSEMPTRKIGRGRLLHYGTYDYPLGRHFDYQIGAGLLIYRVASCLVNEAMILRRLQIQSKIQKSEQEKGHGSQHHDNGKGLTSSKLIELVRKDRINAVDVGNEIRTALLREMVVERISRPNVDFDPGLLSEVLTVFDLIANERDSLKVRSETQLKKLEKKSLKIQIKLFCRKFLTPKV